jgi:hypothetical protein
MPSLHGDDDDDDNDDGVKPILVYSDLDKDPAKPSLIEEIQ